MNFDETQALDSSTENSDEEPEVERNRKLVGTLKLFKQQDLEEKEYKIYEGDNFIGRDESSDVYIPKKSLSKIHACIEVTDDLHLIYDNNSKNKTRRDKVALRPKVRYELKTGDQLTLADLNLQYFIGDISQVDNDDSGSETGSESMLPIDANTGNVAAENKDDISKVYAAGTESDTDDEKAIKQDKPKDRPQEQASTDDSSHESKPKVPNLLYDSYDEDDEMISGEPHNAFRQKDADLVLDVHSEGATLAFGLVSPTEERPFIRPAPKQAIKETPAILLYPLNNQSTKGSQQKDCVPSTLIYASQAEGSLARHSPTRKEFENTSATLLYTSQTQDKETRDDSPQKVIENTPATLLCTTQTQDKETRDDSPQKVSANTPATLLCTTQIQDKVTRDDSPQKVIENTPATFSYTSETQDKETRDDSPQKIIENTPATLLYTAQTQDKLQNNETRDESDIFEPETQGLTPNEASFCLPMQSYIKETPAESEERPKQVSSIPESEDDEDGDDVKKVLSFDESATQAYTWNDGDATDDEDVDDLRFQSTQAYSSNTESKEEDSNDEHSNPDLYATTGDLDTKGDQEEKGQVKDTTVQSRIPCNVDDIETEVCKAEEKLPTKSSGSKALDVNTDGRILATQVYTREEVNSQGIKPKKGVKGHVQFKKDLQQTIPYNIEETQRYEPDEETIKPTVMDEMVETQAYEACTETTSSNYNPEKTPENCAQRAQDIEKTLPYSMMETQGYEVDEDLSESKQNFKSHIEKGIAREMEPTLPYSIVETQAYDDEDDLETKSESLPETESRSLPGNLEPTLPYDVVDTEDMDKEDSDDVVIPETQAYGLQDDSETDDEGFEECKAGTSGVVESLNDEIEHRKAKDDGVDVDTVTQDRYDNMQDLIDEVIPDSEDMIPKETTQPKTTRINNDQNNNSTSDVSKNQEKTSITEEVTEIIIRPVRRGRGRVTQDDHDQPLIAKSPKRAHPRSKSGKNNKKGAQQDGTNHVNEEVSMSEAPNSTKVTRRSRKTTKERTQRNDENDMTAVESPLNTSTMMTRRSVGNKTKITDKEEKAGTVIESAEPFQTTRRTSKRTKSTVDKMTKENPKPEQKNLQEEVVGSMEKKDSEEQFVFKGKSKGKKKGKQPVNKLVKIQDSLAERDSEDLPSLDAILAENKTEQDEPKIEDLLEKPHDEEDNQKSVQSVSLRRGRGRVTQSDDALDNMSTASKAAKSRSTRHGKGKPSVADTSDLSQTVTDESQSSTSSISSKGRGKRGRSTRTDDGAKTTRSSLETSISTIDPDDIMSPNTVAKSITARHGKAKTSVANTADLTQTVSDESQSSTSSISSKGRGKRGILTRADDGDKSEDGATPAKIKKDNKDNSISKRSSQREQHMPRVMFTGVIDKDAEKTVTRLGGTMEESIYNCTHLITDKVRRTVKFLCGLGSGQIIVIPAWLNACKKSKKFIDHEPFFVQDKAAEKMYSFSLRQSHEQALTKGLLNGYKIHVTKNVKPEPQQMKDIIQCAKGEYLTRMPRTKEDNVIVISCEVDHDACKPAIASGIPVYSAELLLTGILRQEISLDQNLLFAQTTENTPATSSSVRKRRNDSVGETSQHSSRSSKRKRK